MYPANAYAGYVNGQPCISAEHPELACVDGLLSILQPPAPPHPSQRAGFVFSGLHVSVPRPHNERTGEQPIRLVSIYLSLIRLN